MIKIISITSIIDNNSHNGYASIYGVAEDGCVHLWKTLNGI